MISFFLIIFSFQFLFYAGGKLTICFYNNWKLTAYNLDISSDGISQELRSGLMNHNLNRRTFLTTAASTLALPFVPLAGYAADVDVIIIGAGAAGLSAARYFMRKGISFKLLEAKNRTGGRALTDTHTFGKPFDWGCTFLHNSDQNPFVDFAKKQKLAVDPVPADRHSHIWINQREASTQQYRDIDRRQKLLEKAMADAAESGRDISLFKAVRKLPKSNYDEMIANWLLPGIESKNASIMDWWNGAEGKDRYCPAGYGTLVQYFANGVPVELGVEVNGVDWSGNGVKISTSKGTITANHCIVTVSNGVLDSGMIEFTPPLKKRQEVVHGIPLARYSTVGLKFSRSKIVSTPTNAWLHALDDNDKHIAWAGNIGGSGVLRANIHGQAAEDLEQEGKAALIDHVTVKLKNLLGGDKLPKLMKADTYLWSVDPHILDTWSAASPGFGNKRKQLRYSYGNRVHFAGEACHKDMYSTCHGAMLSGATTAAKISKIL